MTDDLPANHMALKEPIPTLQTEGDQTQEVLIFESPRGKHIRRLGLPFDIADGGAKLNSDTVGKYIELCCNLGDGDADKLSAADFIEAQNRILGFFGQ